MPKIHDLTSDSLYALDFRPMSVCSEYQRLSVRYPTKNLKNTRQLVYEVLGLFPSKFCVYGFVYCIAVII